MRTTIICLLVLTAAVCGQITVSGTSQPALSGWEDSQVPALAIATGATAPALTAGWNGNSTLQLHYFQGGSSTNDQCWFTIQMPHAYEVGSTVVPHVHWGPTTNVAAGSDTTVWELIYTWQSIGGTISTDTLTCKSAGGANQQWGHKIASFGNVAGTGKGISSIWVCRLRRLDSHASDTYGSNAAFLGFDIHFNQDAIGSTYETSK